MSRANPRFRRANQPLPAPIPNIFQLSILGLLDGQLTINTFFYWDSGAVIAVGSEANLANAWIANNFAAYKGACSSDWEAQAVSVRCLSSPLRATFFTGAGIAGSPGTGPAGHEPSTVAAVIDRNTQFRGQCGRGRIGVPAVPTAWVTGSVLTNTTSLQALATSMLAVFVGGGVTYVPFLWSRGSRVAHTVGAAPLTLIQLRTVLGTIRRRRIGRGR